MTCWSLPRLSGSAIVCYPAQAGIKRSAERAAGALYVIRGDHEARATERGVRQLDVDVGFGQLAGELAERAGPVLHVDHEHAALVGDAHALLLERGPGAGDVVVVDEQVDDAVAVAGERREAVDVDARRARELADAGELAGPTAWLFGNEAWGLPADLRAVADETVAVPVYGRAESLNLAAAAAVCLYGSARAQRRR
jgi:hypothetical protein